MREVLKLGEQLANKLAEETTIMLAERTMLRDVTAARSRELAVKRDEELARIDNWAEKQKAIVREVFAAMLAENDLDLQKHEEAIRRLNGDLTQSPAQSTTSSPVKPRPRPPLQHAAE
jgi:hypothetical protein